MPVHKLSDQHFKVAGQQKKNLILNVSNPTLVFFKTQECSACSNFEPIFNALSNSEKRVMFAILNLTQFKQIAKMSQVTTTPISTVPFLLLYFGGKPISRFTGKKDAQSLSSFIDKTLNYLKSNSGAVAPQQNTGGYIAPQQQSQQQYNGPVMSAMNNNRAPTKSDGTGYTLDETEDEECLLTPDAIVPYNVAWRTDD